MSSGSSIEVLDLEELSVKICECAVRVCMHACVFMCGVAVSIFVCIFHLSLKHVFKNKGKAHAKCIKSVSLYTYEPPT